MPGRVQELVEEGDVVAVVSAEAVAVSVMAVDRDDVGLRVVDALRSVGSSPTELARRDAEAGAQVAKDPDDVAWDELRVDHGRLRFREVGMPDHGVFLQRLPKPIS